MLTEDLNEISRAAHCAAQLTEQIGAFLRRQAVRPKIVCLNDVVNDLRLLLQRTLGKDVDVRLVLDPELGTCEVNPYQFASVLMNIVVNARDAMPQGGRLTVKTANLELDAESCQRHDGCPPGDCVMLSILDTGTGMDKRTQAQIFEPFFTTKDASHGTGLGLSRAQSIIEERGGRILVDSEPGRGSTFTIYLPRSERATQSDAA
jgi:two-component system, cell cycle sensor histidine kinase and response regulator CckA